MSMIIHRHKVTADKSNVTKRNDVTPKAFKTETTKEVKKRK